MIPWNSMGKGYSSINGAGKMNEHIQKSEVECYITLYTKIISKWKIDLNTRVKTKLY